MNDWVIGGRYQVGSVIGEGGVARIHVGFDLKLRRRVAVKVPRRDAPDTVDRFLAEARTTASLGHPNVVALLDAGIDVALERGPGVRRPWLVLEMVEGPNLARWLDLGHGSGAAARIGAEVATALAHAHAHGVVHRDVKPANILLTPQGRAKLADFGVSSRNGSIPAGGHSSGTATYLAPEQVARAAATQASDVYALGLVLLEMLTGRRPHTTQVAAVPVSLGPRWTRLLHAMTTRDAAHRPTAHEVATRLVEISTGPRLSRARSQPRSNLHDTVADAVTLAASA